MRGARVSCHVFVVPDAQPRLVVEGHTDEGITGHNALPCAAGGDNGRCRGWT